MGRGLGVRGCARGVRASAVELERGKRKISRFGEYARVLRDQVWLNFISFKTFPAKFLIHEYIMLNYHCGIDCDDTIVCLVFVRVYSHLVARFGIFHMYTLNSSGFSGLTGHVAQFSVSQTWSE